MYLSTRAATAAARPTPAAPDPAPDPDLDGRPEGGPAAPARTGSEANVWYLGLTSLFTDVSSEMVLGVLPIYLTLYFGFTPLQFGVFDGAYRLAAAVMTLVAALVADRWRRPKEVAAFGYGLSALCTLGLVAAKGLWAPTTALLYGDRMGKGVRTAPRDAMISMSVTRDRLGRAFGLHRAMDTVGAVVGPVAGSMLLARDRLGFDTVFAVGFFIALIGLAILVLFVRPPAVPDGARPAPTVPSVVPPGADRARRPTVRPLLGLVRQRPFRAALLVGLTLALATPGDNLIFLTFLRDADIDLSRFPLLNSAMALVFLVAAVPMGRLADRVGRLRIFLGGEVLLLGVMVVLASGVRSTASLVLLLVLLGGHYAATAGVLVALASPCIPPSMRASGLAVLATVVALGNLFGSSLFGSLWGSIGGPAAARVFAVALLGAVGAGVLILRRAEQARLHAEERS